MVKTVAKVDDMMCTMCEQHVSEAIRQALPVKKVSASHTKGTATIESEEPLDMDKLAKAINDSGYTFVSADTEEVKKKHGLFHRN